MASDKALTASYFLDLIIKAGIAACVAVAGWHFKSIDEKLTTLQSHDASQEVRLSVGESGAQSLGKQLDRLEQKVDRILEIAKKVQ